MMIRPETGDDVAAIRAVTSAAFTKPGQTTSTVEARLVDDLRADPGWIPVLSLVAVADGAVVGHVASTRGYIADTPVLGLGPLSVLPAHQGTGIGKALVHTTLGAAEALGEPAVILLGSPEYYQRFGFQPASAYGIDAPDPQWGRFFQVRPLRSYDPAIRGAFRYAEPFTRL